MIVPRVIIRLYFDYIICNDPFWITNSLNQHLYLKYQLIKKQ